MITVAGQPLLLEDAEVDLNDWMRRFQSLDDLRQFGCLPPFLMSERKHSRNGQVSGVGLPLPNFSEDRLARVNSLYWPTGASRWGRFYGLADEATKDLIVTIAGLAGGGQRVRLEMGDEDHSTLYVDLWLLPPHPISAAEGEADENLWLIPLVDDRYWWQFMNIGDFEVTGTTTWNALLAQIESKIRYEIFANYNRDPVSLAGAYLNPDPWELTRKYDNVALLLDAICASVGRRFTFGFIDNIFYALAQSYSDALANYEFNIATGTWQLAAGGQFGTRKSLPEKVVVTFPKWSWGVPWCNGDVWPETVTPATGTATIQHTFKEIHSSCYADMTLVSQPKNQATLSSLATQIASDYYAWFGREYDYTYIGIKPWLVNCLDDYVEWTFGRQLANGQYQAHTRIASQPQNFGVESQLSQNPNWVVLGRFQIGKLAEDLISQCNSGSGYANVDIWDTTAGAEVDIEFQVRAYGWPWSTDAFSGEGVELHWHCEENAWYAFPVRDGPVVFLEATACFYPGQTATFKLLKYNETTQIWEDSGRTVTATDSGFWNCVLIGERVWGKQSGCGRYELLGPYGLFRKAKAGSEIACGSSGTVTLYSDKTNNSCSSSASNCTVSACNNWGKVRKVKADEEVFVAYFGTNPLNPGNSRKWTIMPFYAPRWAIGTLSGAMCPEDSSGGISGVQTYADGCANVSVSSALNVFSLAGEGGKKVMLFRREEDDEWIIVQVQHRLGYYAVDASFDSSGCELRLSMVLEGIAVMGCGQYGQIQESIQLTSYDVITGWSIAHEEGSQAQSGSVPPTAGECTLSITKQSICALPGTGQTTVTQIQLTPTVVMQDLDVDGLCFEAVMNVVYTLCADSPADVTLFCGSNCGSGSGSGDTSDQGQGGGQ